MRHCASCTGASNMRPPKQAAWVRLLTKHTKSFTKCCCPTKKHLAAPRQLTRSSRLPFAERRVFPPRPSATPYAAGVPCAPDLSALVTMQICTVRTSPLFKHAKYIQSSFPQILECGCTRSCSLASGFRSCVCTIGLRLSHIERICRRRRCTRAALAGSSSKARRRTGEGALA